MSETNNYWDYLYRSPGLQQVRQAHCFGKIRVDTVLKDPCVPELTVQSQLTIDGSLERESPPLLEDVRSCLFTVIIGL